MPFLELVYLLRECPGQNPLKSRKCKKSWMCGQIIGSGQLLVKEQIYHLMIDGQKRVQQLNWLLKNTVLITRGNGSIS